MYPNDAVAVVRAINELADHLENIGASIDKLAEIFDGHNSTGRGGLSDKEVEKGSIPLCPTKKTYTITQEDLEKAITEDPEVISDDHGSSWSIWCPMCNRKSMQIVRPGKAQCGECG